MKSRTMQLLAVVLLFTAFATADTTITAVGFYNGDIQNGNFVPTAYGEDTIHNACCAVAAISAPDPATESIANPFYNNADGTITNLSLGHYWAWIPDPYWGWNPSVPAGPLAQVVVNLSNGTTLVSYFQIGSWTSAESWNRVGGSDLISLGSTGITDQNKVTFGDTGLPNYFWLHADARNDGILDVQIVPEPASMTLFASGLAFLVSRRRRKPNS